MKIIRIDSHDLEHFGYTYIGWLPSGQSVAGYENVNDFIAVSPKMIVNALDSATESVQSDKCETPFSNWNIPEKVFEVEIQGHTNLFVMPVSRSYIVTTYGDNSLGHNVENITNLKSTVQQKEIDIRLRADSPFRTDSWSL